MLPRYPSIDDMVDYSEAALGPHQTSKGVKKAKKAKRVKQQRPQSAVYERELAAKGWRGSHGNVTHVDMFQQVSGGGKRYELVACPSVHCLIHHSHPSTLSFNQRFTLPVGPSGRVSPTHSSAAAQTVCCCKRVSYAKAFSSLNIRYVCDLCMQ